MSKKKKIKDCDHPLKKRKTEIIDFRCDECGYEKQVVVKDKEFKMSN